ncbi:MAG: uracil-DNA glycosylase [Paracoccaceae bacterium]
MVRDADGAAMVRDADGAAISDEAERRAAMLAALAWQVELGADEAIEETGVDRFALAARETAERAATSPALRPTGARGEGRPTASPHEGRTAVSPRGERRAGTAPATDPHAAVRAAADLAALDAAGRALLADRLGPGERLAFAEGAADARLMVVADAPEPDAPERVLGGRAGVLLDRMLAAIGRARDADDPARGACLACLVPWRPAAGPGAAQDAAALCTPVLERRLALQRPRAVLVLGNAALACLGGETGGLRRARGRWIEHASGTRLRASFHPRTLLEAPERKRDAWADLLALAEGLEG